MVCGWMAWSGLLVLVVKCVGKFSLPGDGFIFIFLFFFTFVAGFGIHRDFVRRWPYIPSTMLDARTQHQPPH